MSAHLFIGKAKLCEVDLPLAQYMSQIDQIYS